MTTPLLPTDDQIERGLARLLQHIDAHPVMADVAMRKPAVRRTRPAGLRIGIGAVAVAAATITIVIAGTLSPNGGGASAQAAEVLIAAATATVSSSDPVAGAGQYLKVETVASYTSQNLTGATGSFQYQYVTSLYIPADRSDQWVWVRDQPAPTIATNPDNLAAALKSWVGESAAEKHMVVRGRPGDAGNTTFSSPDSLQSYSRDPKVLLQQLGGTAKDPQVVGDSAWGKITDLLETGVVPGDLRAALYKAATLIPGVALLGTDQTLNGRSGDAIGLVITSPKTGGKEVSHRQDIIIDQSSGLMIGRRTVTLNPSGKPVGTSGEWTSVQTTIASTAP